MILRKILYIILLVVLYNNQYSFAQNESYNIIHNEINPMLKRGEYDSAKRKFLDISKVYQIDPAERLHFAISALENDDIKYFKKEAVELIRNFGWSFHYSDTLNSTARIDCLKKYDLIDWLVEKSEINFPKWVKNNPIGFEVQQKLNTLLEIDQTRKYFYPLIYGENIADSNSIDEIKESLTNLDYSNILCVYDFSVKYGLPNNFDFGIESYYKVGIVIMHAMQNEINFKPAWNCLYKFIEGAYFQGKISGSIFYFYDEISYKLYGYQYYGTMVSIPIMSGLNLEEQRKKYSL